MCVKDGRSTCMTHCVRVMLQGVPVYGAIDSGADIMILGGRLFKKVALAVNTSPEAISSIREVEFRH